MAVIKYDVSDVPESGSGEQPQPGMYKGKVVSVTHRTKKSNGDPANDLEVVVDVGSEYARLWTYIQLENPASAWKLREFTDALGLPAKGGIDPAKITKQEPEVNVKVSADTDLDGNYRGRVKNLFKPGKVEDDETPAAGGGDDTDYSDWSAEDLTAEIEERGLDLPSGRKTVAKLAEILTAHDASDDDDDAADEPAGGVDLPEDFADVDDWDADDLKGALEELGLSVSGRFSQAKAIEAIKEHFSANGASASGDGDEPAATEDDYDEWELQELKDEVGVRNDQGAEIEISGRQTKEKLIEGLRADDAAAAF